MGSCLNLNFIYIFGRP